MMRARALRAAVIAAAVVAAMIGPVTGASATYPGTPGRIIFVATEGGASQLYSIRGRDGLRLRQITHFHHAVQIEFPSVSPDGRLIVFSAGTPDTRHLYLMNADGTDRHRVTDDPGFEMAPSFSPDGSRIVYAGDEGLFTIALDGTDRAQITSGPDFKPQYTPDGSKIVFESGRGGLISAIWSMDADGSNLQRLTPGRLRAGGTDISPDGQHIVFFGNENYPLPTSLFTMDIDGSNITRLTRSAYGHNDVWPAYSPDGSQIVFATDRAYPDLCCFEVWTMRADGSHPVPLTSNLTPDGCDNDNCVYPAWSQKPLP